MKLSQQTSDDNNTENVQAGPKFRNINDEKDEVIEEKPEGADVRLKIAVGVIAAFILIIGIKGSITKSNLSSELEAQQKLLTEAKAEALLYGITEDEDGDLVVPETNTGATDVSELDWDSIEQRNNELLNSFTKLLLTWKGQTGYNNVRQKLINEWEFTEDSRLLTTFMPELSEDDDVDANITLSGYEPFVLDNDGKNMSYFLICTVRNTIDGTSTTGTVGIRITINEDGTISNVTAQTLS